MSFGFFCFSFFFKSHVRVQTIRGSHLIKESSCLLNQVCKRQDFHMKNVVSLLVLKPEKRLRWLFNSQSRPWLSASLSSYLLQFPSHSSLSTPSSPLSAAQSLSSSFPSCSSPYTQVNWLCLPYFAFWPPSPWSPLSPPLLSSIIRPSSIVMIILDPFGCL